jgi:hypothetical protein
MPGDGSRGMVVSPQAAQARVDGGGHVVAGAAGEANVAGLVDVDLGFGRIVASEIAVPNMLANLV